MPRAALPRSFVWLMLVHLLLHTTEPLQALEVRLGVAAALGRDVAAVLAAADLLLRVQALEQELARGGDERRRVALVDAHEVKLLQQAGHALELADRIC